MAPTDDDATRTSPRRGDTTFVRPDDTASTDPNATRLNESGRTEADGSADPLVGRKLLDRYLVVRKIGSGGFGSVYHVSDELKKAGGERHEIAIKTLDLNVSAQRLSGLIQEVSRSHVVSHPNILRVYDIHQDGELAFITMELLVGESLEDRLANRECLSEKEVDRIAEAMCSALGYCHDQNLIHSDIKPANIFLCEDGSLKLLDLGIAQIVGSANRLAGYSPRYASPEQAANAPPDPRDDLFSLACVLYEALTGKHAFDGQSPTEAMAAAYRPDITTVPRRYRRAIAAGLEYSRDDRPPTMQRFWTRISPLVRKRYLIAAGITAVTALGFVASNQIGEQVGKSAISVSAADQAYAQVRLEEARGAIDTGAAGDARQALVDALQHNPYLEEAAELLVLEVRGAAPSDPTTFSLAWSDFAAALAASPTSESLLEYRDEAAAHILERDPTSMSRLEVLSQLRVPLCALETAGYRDERLSVFRDSASISC